MTAEEAGARLDQLSVAARKLQARHATSKLRPRPVAPWSRRKRISGWVQRARAAAANPSPEVARAAEWLLDNDYQVQRAVVQIEQDLPRGFYRRLPSLKDPAEDGALQRAIGQAVAEMQAARGVALSSECLSESRRFLPERVVESHLRAFERLVS